MWWLVSFFIPLLTKQRCLRCRWVRAYVRRGSHQPQDPEETAPVAKRGNDPVPAKVNVPSAQLQEAIIEEVVRRAAEKKPAYIPQIPEPPDFRDKVCPAFVQKIKGKVTTDKIKLPNTSVIFCFCNEPSSSLYHSIHSVIERSPPELLHEIILGMSLFVSSSSSFLPGHSFLSLKRRAPPPTTAAFPRCTFIAPPLPLNMHHTRSGRRI